MNHSIPTGSDHSGLEIAVIGMAGRFPGAKHLQEFWNNLVNGMESISFFSEEELIQGGIDPGEVSNPNYVKAKGILEDIEYFDPLFFKHSPRESEILSPQTRISLECAWEALEDAGYEPGAYKGAIGVFIGASHSVYWEALSDLSGKSDNFGKFEATMLANKDFLSTRISYKLNLRGPSFNIFTGCSTSGVSIHQACQSLLSGESDMALAGGVSVWLPKKSGYLYQEGSIFSSEGHCRVFDQDANGTIFGDGIGIVVLKPLEDAVAHRDHIYAVIKGSGINNDGSRKVGYPAPSTEGETAAIRAAHHLAGVKSESITYVETHGTGTSVGDPIEIEALKLAFNTNKKGFCKIGSVKSNIGHLNTAAGVSGFIKAVLALKHRLIPPTINFVKPNPRIDFENSPFQVNTQLTPWDHWKNDAYPLRAGISAFGVGGTNVHMVLEEAPYIDHSSVGTGKTRDYQLITLSAKTETALEKITGNLLDYLKKNPSINLADAAYTLQVGRRLFKHRKTMVCSTVEEAAAFLSSPGTTVSTYCSPQENISLIFMLPGQGSQYVNMGLELYKTEPVFREEMDRCFKVLNKFLDYDIKEIIYPGRGEVAPPVGEPPATCLLHLLPDINQTEIAQPLLFVFEYVLSKLLINWIGQPFGMIGHSIGEYVAACLSGVFSLEDALKLVVLRGKLMQQMPPGAMLGVQLPEKDLTPLIISNDQLALAAVNGPSLCVAAGPHEAVGELQEKLEKEGIKTRPLYTSHAFHSPMMDPILNQFEQEVAKIRRCPPTIPYISNVSGTWITADQVTNPTYWSSHLRRTVRFSDGVRELLKEKNPVFVEVGPGNTLGTLVRKMAGEKIGPIVNLVRHPREKMSDTQYLLDKLGRLWLWGNKIDWQEFYSHEKRYRIPLPTYPFERQYYWIEGNPFKMTPGTVTISPGIKKKPDISDWFYIPLWKQSIPPAPENKKAPGKSCWLVFLYSIPFGIRLVKQLEALQQDVITVKTGTGFFKESEGNYSINPDKKGDYEILFKDLQTGDRVPNKIIHLWGVNNGPSSLPTSSRFDDAQHLGFYSLVYLSQVLEQMAPDKSIRILVVTNNLHDVTGGENLAPEKATVLGPVIAINQECANLSCQSIDISLPEPGTPKEETMVRQLLCECMGESTDMMVAYRNNHRWERYFKSVHWEEINRETSKLKKNGVYLITGGLGNIGFILAKELAARVGAKLVLTGRTSLPPDSQWEQWLAAHPHDPLAGKLKKVRELKSLGSEVLVFSVDTADREQMEKVIRISEERLGPINGVIHAAGIVGQQSFSPIGEIEKENCRAQFQAKVHGILVLEAIFRDRELDFCLLMSSIASILGGLGLTTYSAANLFMDAFAAKYTGHHQTEWITTNWDIWQVDNQESELIDPLLGVLKIIPGEGAAVFHRVLSWSNSPQVVVSTGDLQTRLEQWAKIKPEKITKKMHYSQKAPVTVQSRKGLLNPYIAPRNQVERIITNVLQDYFGFEQIGIHDNFFELGATSMDIIQISNKLNGALGMKIPLIKTLTYTTVNSFADYFINEVINNKAYNKEINRTEIIKKGKKSLGQKLKKRRDGEASK